MIPGSDLLKTALTVIASSSVQYYHCTGRALNSIGVYQPTYAAPVTLLGSLQPVPRRLYEQLNLDFQKDYVTLYVSNDLIDVQRDATPDYFIFNSKTYNCISSNDWFAVDGWVGILSVLVTGAAD